MARPAPAANRAIEILNFLAAHPTESFTLSELAKHLDINGASMHAVLAVLTTTGYIVRHTTHRTYALGPSVIALGAAALERHPGIDMARSELRALAEELHGQVVLTAATADEILFLDRAGRYTGNDPSPRVGERVPLVPPLGAVFVAWSSDARIDEWLSRMVDPSPTAIEACMLHLNAVRTHGYALGLEGEARGALGRALIELTDYPRASAIHERVRTLVAQLGREPYGITEGSVQRHAVSMIAAPVFGPAGEVALAFAANGMTKPLSTTEIDHIGKALVRAADRVTAATFGRRPKSVPTISAAQ